MSLKYNYFKKIKTIYAEIKCMDTATQRLWGEKGKYTVIMFLYVEWFTIT